MTRCAACRKTFKLAESTVTWFRANCPQWLGDPWWCPDCVDKAAGRWGGW